MTAHHVNVEGHAEPAGVRAETRRIARPRRDVHLPVVDRRPMAFRIPRRRRGPARVREDEYLHPTTMYGCNKLYAEELGRYYAKHYKQLSVDSTPHVDFRAVRFPGLISAATQPAGGTSDYASEMIHAAAKGEPYACFVRPDTRIPFMAMPDAVRGAARAGGCAARAATPHGLQRRRVQRRAPPRSVTLSPPRFPAPRSRIRLTKNGRRSSTRGRPMSTIRRRAPTGGSEPAYDFERAFREYLIPTISRRYTR